MAILCLKMNTGEDVIAKVVKSVTVGNMLTDNSDGDLELGQPLPDCDVVISDPRVITLQEVPGNRMALALVPYLMGDHEASMVISLKRSVVGIYKARKEIEDSYIAQTSSIDLSATLGKKIN